MKTVLAILCILAAPSVARADLVHLKSGRVLSVESWELKGDIAILVLRDGGRMEAPEALIAEVFPDEYLRPKRPPPAAAALAPADITLDGLHALVAETAGRYGVDVKLAQAVVKVESDYVPGAVSRKGAKGLMQLMPSVADAYAVADAFDPAQNLDAGVRHLRGLLDRFKNDVTLALAAYNAGLFAVAKYGGVPPFPETQQYVRRILTLAR
jgi:soluble lytic murein transglycosylase-like protein